MTPFKHNIRNLRKAYRAASPVRQQMIHTAALANNTCQMNLRYPAALSSAEKGMREAMDAVGVEPVSKRSA
jgi:hypothetical protein